MNRSDRQRRVRAKIKGTSKQPRLSIFRSNKYIYCQAIDDEQGATLAQADSKDPAEVGSKIGQALIKKKIKTAVLDRAGYKYHGQVKVMAESARQVGLSF